MDVAQLSQAKYDRNVTEMCHTKCHTVEPRYNEPLYNEVVDITNDFLFPSNSKIYEKEPRNNETS